MARIVVASSGGSITKRVSVALIVLSLASCGGGGGGSASSPSSPSGGTPPPPPPPAPRAELSGPVPAEQYLVVTPDGGVSSFFYFTNVGTEPLEFSVASSTPYIQLSPVQGVVAPADSAQVDFSVRCDLEDIDATVTLTTNDPDRRTVPMPFVIDCQQPGKGIDRLMLNQGATGFDSNLSGSQSIDIVADRDMLVRVYVLGEGEVPEGGVIIEQPGLAPQRFEMHRPPMLHPIQAYEDARDLNFWARIPGDVLRAGTTLRIEVDQFGEPPLLYPPDGPMPLQVVDHGVFRITFVPIVYNGVQPQMDLDQLLVGPRGVLPLGRHDAGIRAPYTYSGPYDLQDMLAELAQLRILDGSSRYYHGVVVPDPDDASNTVGVAHLGSPVSVSHGRIGRIFTVAHELGHNLNLRHAPACNAPLPDTEFPYPDGGIGVQGFDLNGSDLVSATSGSKDFMSYCDDPSTWVSDYHFRRALQFLVTSAAGQGQPASLRAAAALPGLMISGTVQQGVWRPLTILPAPAGQPGTEAGTLRTHRFVGWNRNGVEIVDQGFDLVEVAHVDDAHFFAFVTPHPGDDIHHFEIRRVAGDSHTVVHSASMRSGSMRIPDAASVSWDDDSAHVRWPSESGTLVILRDHADRVLSINRTGYLALRESDSFTVELIRDGVVVSRTRYDRPGDPLKRVAP